MGFPNLGSCITIDRHKDWISQERQLEWYLEVWRFYQSGQFVDVRGIEEDWWDNSTLSPPPSDWAHGRFLGVEGVVDQFTEVFEFASRLAFTAAGDKQMHLEKNVHGIKGRRLAANFHLDGASYFKTLIPSAIDFLPYKIDLPETELVAMPRELAMKPSAQLFHRFGWNPSINTLQDIQGELFRVRPFATR